MAPLSMHCVPPSKRHALCNANGRSWRRRTASWQLHCTCLRPASNSPVTNRRASASFLDMPHVHTRIRISTPHVGVLITFIGACAPPFRHRKRTATKQRLLQFAGASRYAAQVSRHQAQRLTRHRVGHIAWARSRAPQRALAAAPAATGPAARRSANRRT